MSVRFGQEYAIPHESILKPLLKPDRSASIIQIDENSTLTCIPQIAWEYKLGNRSALDCILDKFKEKKPRDKTIPEKFNTYKFSDYRNQVIDLIKRVCTVSVETMKIVKEMEAEFFFFNTFYYKFKFMNYSKEGVYNELG